MVGACQYHDQHFHGGARCHDRQYGAAEDHDLIRHFNGSAQWILTAYMLAFAIMLPSSGWFADRFGYKRAYAVGLSFFTLFSLLCGISWNEKSLIVMRIGQGLGGGFLQPIGMAIIMREFPA